MITFTGLLQKPRFYKVLILVLTVLLLNIFAYLNVKQERYIYFWDNSRSWDMSRDLVDFIGRQSPLKSIRLIYSSINTMEYNYLPVIFLLPFYFVFGTARVVNILSILNVFLIPSLIICALLLSKLFGKSIFVFLSSSLLILFFLPFLIIPVLIGYEDIVSVFLIGLILYLFLTKTFEEQGNKTIILLGILLAILAVLRRYFAIWVFSFLLIIVIGEVAMGGLYKYRFKYKYLVLSLKKVAYLVTSFFLSAGIIAWRHWKEVASSDYSHLYSAYKTENSFLKEFVFNSRLFLIHFGLIIVLISLGGVFYGSRNTKFRRINLLLVPHFLVTILFFSKIQDLSTQHYYLFIPSLIIFAGIFNFFISKKLLTICQKGAYLIILFILSLLSCFLRFDKESKFSKPFFGLIFGGARYYQMVRNDLSQINDLVSTIKNLLLDQNDNLYVLASSSILNDDIIRQACYQTEGFRAPICEWIMLSAHVDERDGFPNHLHEAKYIITTDPIQYHLKPSSQQVVIAPSQELLNSVGFGKNFNRLEKCYYLDGGVEVCIYERKAGIDSQSVLSDLSELESKIFSKTKGVNGL